MITGQGQGHFLDGSRSPGKVMSCSLAGSKLRFRLRWLHFLVINFSVIIKTSNLMYCKL